MTALPPDVPALVAGGKAALARALTALETDADGAGLQALLAAAWAAPRGLALGLTGPPGVGKSTLIGVLVAALRARGETVAVIAVDPSSRRSGGALLGDRTRILSDPDDGGVFVRSMAARSRLGGLADQVFPAMVLMRAVYDWVLVETVGVGQSETEIADCADLVVFCAQPGSGDVLQFMKAGVMEVPDIVLVTKGDLGAPAVRAAADVRRALGIVSGAAPGAAPAVAIVSARTGAGVDAAIAAIAARREAMGSLAGRRAAQGRAWSAARLVESFGRVGAAALAPRIASVRNPFAGLGCLMEAAREAVHESLKNL